MPMEPADEGKKKKVYTPGTKYRTPKENRKAAPGLLFSYQVSEKGCVQR